jgi:hypothetical protein
MSWALSCLGGGELGLHLLGVFEAGADLLARSSIVAMVGLMPNL